MVQYHEVKINIDFETKANCVKSGSGPAADLDTAALWVDYIFLDTDERRRFAQLSHEYLIEQLQFTGDESLSGTSQRIKLNFNHPCKELIWAAQRGDVSSNAWTNYVDNNDKTSGKNIVKTAKLQLNGHDRFAERAGEYFNLVQPFQHHENVPANKGINVYSFALSPEQHQPSGTLNMSRIDTAVLNMTNGSLAAGSKLKTFAVSYNVLRVMSGGPPSSRKKLHASPKRLDNRYVASPTVYGARILVVRGHPESLTYQGYLRKQCLAQRQLGYGNNGKDWAIRMVTTYGRYVKPMVGRQRLNGIRLAMKSETLRASLRYSPSHRETYGVKRWVDLL